MPGRGYVGVFSSTGKLIAFSDKPTLVKKVAAELIHTLPTTPFGDPAGMITEARRKALQKIALCGENQE